MRTFLAFVGLLGLLGMAYAMGSQQAEPEEIAAVPPDPFEGFALSYAERTHLTVVCRQQGARDAEPTRECVANQVSARRRYDRMRGIYPRRSPGWRALERCRRGSTVSSRFVDYAMANACTMREIASIEASRRGGVKIIQ